MICVAYTNGMSTTCPECRMAWDNGEGVTCGRTLLTEEEIKTNLTKLRDSMPDCKTQKSN